MIKSVKFTNYLNESITVDLKAPEKSGLLIYSISGLEPVKANINQASNANADGTTFLSAKVSSRNIVIGIIFEYNELGETIEELRNKTYKYFPSKKAIKLEIEFESGAVWNIDGYVESNSSSIFSARTGTQISIICPQPYFYNSINMVTNFSNVTPGFEFPFSNESLTEPLIEFTSLNYEREKNMYYDGDVITPIQVEMNINGPIGDIYIYQTNTNSLMLIQNSVIAQIVGSELKSGDFIYLDTSISKMILTLKRDGVTYNIINAIPRPISWIHIHPGDNTFIFDTESVDKYLEIVMRNQVLKEGL